MVQCCSCPLVTLAAYHHARSRIMNQLFEAFLFIEPTCPGLPTELLQIRLGPCGLEDDLDANSTVH